MAAILPLELFELIFTYCDSSTLKALKLVRAEWAHLIDRLLKKRCLINIPDLYLLEYKHCRSDRHTEAIIFEDIWENWEKWAAIERHIRFESVPFIYELKYVSCVSAFDNYIAVGLDTGAVNLYNDEQKLIKSYEPLLSKEPQTISFVPDYTRSNDPIALLVEYKQATGIHDFTKAYTANIIEHHSVFAAYQQFICCVTLNGTVTIAQIIHNHDDQKMSFIILKLAQLEVANNGNIFASLTNDQCMILNGDNVFVINYNSKTDENENENNNIEGEVLKIGSFDFAMNSVPVLWRDAVIFYNKVIITNSQPRADTGQIFEVFVLQDGVNGVVPSVKMFYLSDAFQSLITCVCLYGNTLVLGLASGELLFYEVNDWENFDLRKYAKVITMHTKLGRIMSIDVVESRGRRVFYVAGPTFVRKVTGSFV